MLDFLTLIVLGIAVVILGIVNMTGNISTLHRYHRKRVIEEDIKPFGRLVGLGTVIMGVAFIIYGVLKLVSEQMQIDILLVVGTVELIVGIVVGMGLDFYAMIKYNKGIF